MTSHVSHHHARRAESIRTPLVSVTDVLDADSGGPNAEFNMKLARRYDEGFAEGASTASAAFFAGLLVGTGSTALMIWLATTIL